MERCVMVEVFESDGGCICVRGWRCVILYAHAGLSGGQRNGCHTHCIPSTTSSS